jgi:hypothetical protein
MVNLSKKNFNKAVLYVPFEPFVGMWRDREEMRDSSAWIRNVRETHWGKE